MAKSTAKQAKPKASKPQAKPKKAAVEQKEVAKAQPAEQKQVVETKKEAPKKSGGINKGEYMALISGQFNDIRKTLSGTCEAKKQPRPLRWALKTLAMAEEAAVRAITHSD